MGDFPLEAVEMLAKIAKVTEPFRLQKHFEGVLKPQATGYQAGFADHIAGSVQAILSQTSNPAAIIIPTESGHTARNLTRTRLPVWILAMCQSEKVRQELMFSYGIWPIEIKQDSIEWKRFVKETLDMLGLKGDSILTVEGPSPTQPDKDNKIEIIKLT